MGGPVVEVGISGFRPKRHVEVFTASEEEMKSRGHYSNHCVEFAAQFDAFADSSRIGMQFVLPELVSEHHNRSGAGTIFRRAKHTSVLGLNSEHREEFGRDSRASRKRSAGAVEVVIVAKIKGS